MDRPDYLLKECEMDHSRPIVYHLLIGGYRQHFGQPTGMYRLREKLVNNYHYCNGHSRVELHEWNSDWKAVVRNLVLLQQDTAQPLLIGVYAYSYGVGWGAMQLAKYMSKCISLNLKIDKAVFCDGVFRHPLLIMRWMSLLKRRNWLLGDPIIKLPPNVFREIYCFRQEIGRPQGHYILPTDDEVIIHPPVLLPRNHADIDDAPEFHNKVLEVAEELRQKAGYSNHFPRW